MNSLQAIFTISLCFSTIGFFGYVYEVISGNVSRFTRWRELNLRQWFYFVMAVQFVAVLPALFIFKSFA